MKVRAFFALRLPDRVSRQLSNFADELCEFDRGLDAHWVDSSSFHLTLCFLGEISIDQVEELQSRAQEILSSAPFSVQLDRIGYYAVSPKLSVIAAMARLDSDIAALHNQMVQVATDCGVEYTERDFLPHVTLARLPSDNQFSLDAEQPVLDLNLPADSIVLLQSRPGEKGSVYTPLFEIELPQPVAN